MSDQIASLPFPRGETHFQGDTARCTTVGVEHLVGQSYLARDKDYGMSGSNNTGAPVVLRVVQNKSGGTLTLRNKGVRFGTVTADLGRYVAGHVNSNGGYGLIPDDRYATGTVIQNLDCFYVVESGPVRGRTSSTQTNAHAITQHSALAFNALGQLRKATVGDHVVAQADVAKGTAASNQQLLAWVGMPFRQNR